MTTTISRADAAALIRKWNGENRIFVAHNVKADGSRRLWNVNPKAGRGFILGTGQAQVTNPDHIKVFDMLAAQPRDTKGRFGKVVTNGWRTLNMATVTELRRGKEAFTIA